MTASDDFSFVPSDAPKASRVCAVTGKTFQAGDKIYSVLYESDGQIKRDDLLADAWGSYERPSTTFAWWSSKIPKSSEGKSKATPNDMLVSLFESLVFKPDQADLRYVLALLLARRRVFRFEFDPGRQNAGVAPDRDAVFVYSSRNDACYAVPVVKMDAAQIADVQTRLIALLDKPPEASPSVEELARAAADSFDALAGE